MADIAASDITVTLVKQRKLADSRNSNLVRLAFGDGALTYPAGGIPISKGKLGCPTVIESMVIVDKGTSGYSFMYDQSAEKIVMFQAPAQTHTHNFKVIGGQAAAGTDALSAKTLTLGKEAATDITIAGANSATLGGVVSATLAAGAMVEPSAVTIAAQTIEVEVIGW
jgi:hypothetical protein